MERLTTEASQRIFGRRKRCNKHREATGHERQVQVGPQRITCAYQNLAPWEVATPASRKFGATLSLEPAASDMSTDSAAWYEENSL